MSTPLRFRSTDFTTIGPQVGERFPDVVLPDQHGNRVDLHAVRGDRRALVIFYRSARW
jgi:peroxiredoxin